MLSRDTYSTFLKDSFQKNDQNGKKKSVKVLDQIPRIHSLEICIFTVWYINMPLIF